MIKFNNFDNIEENNFESFEIQNPKDLERSFFESTFSSTPDCSRLSSQVSKSIHLFFFD